MESLVTSWRTVTLGELGADQKHSFSTGPFGSSISKKFFRESGVPVIRGSNLSQAVDVRLNDEGLVFVEQEHASKFKRSMVQEGDLIFTCWGTVGQVGLVSASNKFDSYLISNKQMKMTPCGETVNPRFLYYLLSSPRMIHEVASQAIGTSVPGFNLGQLKDLVVHLPELDTQETIAEVLQSFDDLIENNRRRIEVLEEMARLLYREWFVHFRFPGHEGVEMVDSGLGPIPQGWTVGEFASLVSESKETVSEDDVPFGSPVVGLEHLPRRSTTLKTWDLANDVGSRRKVFEKGDILFGKIRPYFHKVVDAPIGGYSSTDAIVFRPATAAQRALCVAASDEFVAAAVATSNGTKMPRANTELLLRYPIPVPDDAISDQFETQLAPMSNLRRNLAEQNRVLREARDLLLPRLVSGELDVSDLDLGEVLA